MPTEPSTTSTTATTTPTVGTVGAIGPETGAKKPISASGTAFKTVSGSLGTGSGTTLGDNDRQKQAEKEINEVVTAYNQRIQAHITFFNQEVNEFLGELLLISTVGYVVPLGLLSRYHQKVQRLLTEGANICWELGFDYREYQHWSSFSILDYYLSEHVFKASVRQRQTDLIDFRLEAYVQKEAEEVKSARFFRT